MIEPNQLLESVIICIDESLQLNGRSATFDRNTRLLGEIPELDSMAVLTLLTALEEEFGIVVDDDDVTAETFESVGSVESFVQGKISAS